MKRVLAITLMGLLLSACAPKATPPAEPAEPAKPAMPQLSEAEMQKKMKEAATPGAGHAKLQPFVGTWRVQSKFWKAPGAKPEVTTGSAHHYWTLGKRFLVEDFQGRFQKQPFQGKAYIAYDNVSKEYVSTWIDTMSTGIMVSHGDFDPSGKFLTMTASFNCPVSETEMSSKTVTHIVDKNTHTFEMFAPGPDGSEYKMMELTYKRQR